MSTENTFGTMLSHWQTLVELANDADSRAMCQYVERDLFAPLAQGGLGPVGYKLFALVTGGYLPVNSNPLNWKVESSVSFADELTLDEGKVQEIVGKKNVKIQTHTATRYMRQLSRELAEATKPATKGHIENETNRRVNVAIEQWKSLGQTVDSKTESGLRKAIAEQVKNDLNPDHDAHVSTIAQLAFVVAIVYKFSPDLTSNDVRQLLPYHDGFWSNQVLSGNVRLTVADNAPTVATLASKVTAKATTVEAQTESAKA